jgi:GNAT superfamily N-acetyltransferase
MAMIEDDHAVSICASVRISDAVHSAGVEAQVAYRHRGHAVNAVADWAAAVRSLGATPFYGTSISGDRIEGLYTEPEFFGRGIGSLIASTSEIAARPWL